MKVLMSGATGFIGTALADSLRHDGHTVIALTRRRSDNSADILWDPDSGVLDAASIEGFDAAVHLAGENIGASRWTESRKRQILDSRVKGTRLLCETLEKLTSPPRVLVSASAIGYYGDRGDEILTEASPAGKGFLAEVCVAWENSTESAVLRGIRVVTPRFGIVLAQHGGALQRMLLPFKAGVGGPFGSGRQWWSWVLLEDIVRAIRFCIEESDVSGAVNVVAPSPVTNKEFAQTLGSVLHRPAIFPTPAFALKLAIGEMAGPLLLHSQRVIPDVLLNSGFRFAESTLRAALGRVLDAR